MFFASSKKYPDQGIFSAYFKKPAWIGQRNHCAFMRISTSSSLKLSEIYLLS
jgi:hypothetical protein